MLRDNAVANRMPERLARVRHCAVSVVGRSGARRGQPRRLPARRRTTNMGCNARRMAKIISAIKATSKVADLRCQNRMRDAPFA
jgi:hypothetical protein